MKRLLAITIFTCCLISRLLAANNEFGEMVAICRVSFVAKTQAGEMSCSVAVCSLDSDRGSDPSLYVVTAYEREYPPRVVRILEGAHSPVMEKNGDRVSVLFTSGVNTTCVAEFSLAKATIGGQSEDVRS